MNRTMAVRNAIIALSITAIVGMTLVVTSGRTSSIAQAADRNSDEVFPPGMSAAKQLPSSNTKPAAAAPASAQAPLPGSPLAPSPTSTRRPRDAKRDSGKDAEGTAAPNRFEAEIVIKSQYTLDGKPLEVDPD